MTGDEFRYRREMIGLSQKEFAQRLGLSIRTIRNYENGSTKIGRTIELAVQALELEFK